jgi:PAS domain S-box-containing protein
MIDVFLVAVFSAASSAVLVHALHGARASLRERVHSGSETIARALVDQTPRGIHFYQLRSDGSLVFTGFNPAADSILGMNHAPLVGKPIEKAFPSLAGTEIPDRYRAAARSGTPWMTEQIDYVDGQIRGAFEVIAFGVKQNGMAAVFTDITERKRAEKELRSQQEFTSTVLESLPGIFYLYDYPSLTMRFWNRNHETELGFTAEELKNRSMLDWHVPAAREAVQAAVDKVMSEGTQKLEAPLVAKDGRLIPYLLTGTKFTGLKGERYLVGVGIDISERTEAEERLRRLNAELERRVAERTEELSEALDHLRESQKTMMLQEKMAALGQLVAGLAHELNTPLGAIVSAGEANAAATQGLATALPLYRTFSAEEDRVFSRLMRSVWQERMDGDGKAERERRKRFRACLDAARIPHSSLLAEKLVDTGFEGDEAELSELAAQPQFPKILDLAYRISSIVRSNFVVKVAAERAAQVVLALKTYTRRETGAELISTDVRQQLETVLTILRNRIKHEVVVERRFADIPSVMCYPDRLNQVWMNLINNAVQAMGYRGTLELEIGRAEMEGPNGSPETAVTVSVIDDGPGVPEAIKERIFEPFFTTKPAGEGTGLGLDICRRILAEIGATITFESRPGRTAFTVTIPGRNGD